MSVKNLVIGIAIIILTISVVVYGVNTFYSSPEYSDFCEEFKTVQVIETKEQCDAIVGKWNADIVPRPVVEGEKIIEGYCERDYTCREEYEDARQKYSRNVFFIALPLGILIIVFGAVFFGLEFVGAGLMGGGVGTILYGIGGYWRYNENWLRFILSLVALIVLIWFAYWFKNNRSKGKKKRKKK